VPDPDPTVRLTHVGGPTVLVEVAGWRILTDPTFDPPGGEYRFGWGTGSTKLAGPAVEAASLGPIDAVLLTHDHHADNLDTAGRALLADVPTVVTTISGARRLAGLGGEVVGLAAWASTRLEAPGRDPIDVVATPCRHGPPLSHPIVGDVVGFALSWPGTAGRVLWISGDTVLHRDLWQVADRFDVAVALLHLGGVRFPVSGPLRYTMTVDDAVELCTRLRPEVAVPVHYEGWSHFRQGRDAIEERLATAPAATRDAFRFLPLGEPTEIATFGAR
jgi:L-ascorbate metabolism protein UlaG (beta-lactamase superfamily)